MGGGGLLLRVEVDDLALGDCSNTKRLMGRVESGLVEVGLFVAADIAVGGARAEG